MASTMKVVGTGIATIKKGISGTLAFGIVTKVSKDVSADSEEVSNEEADVIGVIFSKEKTEVSVDLTMKTGTAPAIGDEVDVPTDSGTISIIVNKVSESGEPGKAWTGSISGTFYPELTVGV